MPAMPARSRPPSDLFPDLPGTVWEQVEQVLERFEDAWRRGERPALEDYLAGHGAGRLALLVELAHEEMELRLKAGEPASAADYLARFAQLRDEPALAAGLIAAEYHLRHGCGEEPDGAQYLARFPAYAGPLRGLLGPPAQDEDAATPAPVVAGAAQPTPPAQPRAPSPGPAPGSAAGSIVVPPTRADAGTCADALADLPLLPGYAVLGVLGRGGMGVVYQARQLALGRIVALKMIRHAEHAGSDDRRRFRAEAEAMARLQHANVVQVHEVGEHQGLPFFAMEFCPGGSLASRLDGRPWEGRRAAALVQTLARAVEAAHRQGVVHRDLKPGNTLFDADGTPKVTDFGLAKRLDMQGQTRTGVVMGTPSYMAPEQAGGKHKEVGPPADVYALGAILYELLVGRPPFRAATDFDTVMQVLSQEPVAVRRLQPAVARDLETICHKCLEKDPRERYASAATLAEDLRRIQAGEPTLARPAGVLGRAVKWARRKPAAAAALALLVTALVGLTLGLLVVERQRERTQEALRAEARRKNQAREALDAMTSEWVGDLLSRQTSLTDPQRRFLRDALRTYEEFAADTGQDEEGRAGVARAYLRAARIRQRLGEDREAEAAYRSSRDLLERLAGEFPSVAGYTRDLAESHVNLGTLLAHLRRTGEAEGEYRAGLAVLQGLAERFPDVPAYRQDLARVHNNLGVLLRDVGRRDEADPEYRAALAVRERLAGQFPDVAAYREDLALSHVNRGLLLADLGRRDEARQHYRSAFPILERLVEQFPDVPSYRLYLAQAHLNLGALLADMGLSDKAIDEDRASLLIHTRLAMQFPAVPDYRKRLAYSHTNFAVRLIMAGQRAEAEKEFFEAHRIKQALAEVFPDVPDYRRDLGYSHHNLGKLLAELGRVEEADKHFRAAVRIKQDLVRQFPDSPDYAADLGNTYENVGDFSRERKRLDEALGWYGQAIATLRPVLARQAGLASARSHLANAYAGRAEALDDLGRHGDAERDWKGALGLCEGRSRVSIQWRHARALARAGDPEAGVAEAERLGLNDSPARTDYGRACLYALASAADAERRSAYAAKALDRLRRAVAAGYKDFDQMRKDPDLEPLRSYEDFKRLLAGPGTQKPKDP
jgi:tetratricopeptide (TPR) repeat protein